MTVILTGGDCSAQDVQKLDSSIGVRLPSDYRLFLFTHNARQIRACVLPTPKFPKSDKVVIHELMCFCPKTTTDVYYRLEIFRDRIPKRTLPIWADPGGNLILLDLNPDSFGEVFFGERAFEVDEGEVPT